MKTLALYFLMTFGGKTQMISTTFITGDNTLQNIQTCEQVIDETMPDIKKALADGGVDFSNPNVKLEGHCNVVAVGTISGDEMRSDMAKL